MIKIILSSLILFSVSASLACPLGPKETELTISRVMRNFGRFIMPSEALVQKSKNDAGSITETDFTNAITGIEGAAECAFTVLSDKSGKLIPSRADEFQGDARTQYLQKFYAHMNDFYSGLLEEDQLLKQQMRLPNQNRNYQLLKDKAQDIRDRATAAHGDL